MPATFRRFAVSILALLLASAAHAGIAVTATGGATSRDHFKGARFAWSGAGYLKFDEQVLLGFQSGQGTVADGAAIPLLGSAMVRLPLGRIVLPFAYGDLGWSVGGKDPGALWRGGGGFDIRNGRRSSFLLLGAWEQAGGASGWMARGGLLLEF